MSVSLLVWAGWLGATSASISCQDPAPAKHQPTQTVDDVAGRSDPFLLHLLRWLNRRPTTTSPAIAIGNLDAQINELQRQVAGGSLFFNERLVGSLHLRAQTLGTLADLDTALRVAQTFVAQAPKDPTSHQVLARALAALHEFAAAEQALQQALKVGADASTVMAARASMLIAVGRYQEAQNLLSPDDVSPAGLTVRAVVADALGDTERANTLFSQARAQFQDVSPFTLAWMDFERARVAERRDNRNDAIYWLTEALDALPQYAHAAIHLAGYESSTITLKRLDALDPRCDDPEVLAERAEALRRIGQTEQATKTIALAKTRFEQLLQTHPRAFADHAANFYLGIGADLARALPLARSNAAERPTEEAILLWLTTAQIGNAPQDICAAMQALRALPRLRAATGKRMSTISTVCPAPALAPTMPPTIHPP